MARLPYASQTQFAELMRQTGLSADTAPANAFRVLGHAPSIGGAALRFVFALLTEIDLDPRLRELMILRVARGTNGRYAWIQHVAIARGFGAGDEQIAALDRGETPAALLKEQERDAFSFADEVVDDCRPTDDMFAAVRKLFSLRDIVELLLLIRYFRMICGLMTTLEVEVNLRLARKSWIRPAILLAAKIRFSIGGKRDRQRERSS